MKWRKQGLIYAPDGRFDWNKTHAQLPIVDIIDPDRWRIYFATRNARNQSHISYIEVSAHQPQRILYVHAEPILPAGRLGTFDENGLMPVSLVHHRNLVYLYYAGWSLRKTTPYQTAIGLAVSSDGGRHFAKYAEGPLLGARLHEPFVAGTAYVLKEDGLWRMWYQSGTDWYLVDETPEPRYHIKYAESRDGVEWRRDGTVAIDYQSESSEGGLCSASVSSHADGYRMWYCYRGMSDYRQGRCASYRIGYAESPDGIAWQRMDQLAGIDVSDSGWDSQMLCYPCVFTYEETTYMLYNGNRFGESGFGYAILD